MERRKRGKPVKRRAWWAKPRRPDALPRAYFQKFGRVCPATAKEIADEVQRDAIDRMNGPLVETVIWRIAERVGFSRSKVYLYLRAGRYAQARAI